MSKISKKGHLPTPDFGKTCFTHPVVHDHVFQGMSVPLQNMSESKVTHIKFGLSKQKPLDTNQHLKCEKNHSIISDLPSGKLTVCELENQDL